MTHWPYHPLLGLAMAGFILLFISGIPTTVVLSRVHSFNAAVGKVAGAIVVPAWIVTWVQATRLWARHQTLQRQAARANDCLGYGQGAIMPERCQEAMGAASVTPDGFLFWLGAALTFAFIGMAVVLGEAFVDKYLDFSSETLEEGGWFWFIDRRPATISVPVWIVLGLLGPAFIVFELWSFSQMNTKITTSLFGIQVAVVFGWLLFCLYRATRRGVVGVRSRWRVSV